MVGNAGFVYYQWSRNATAISGATSNTYTTVSGDNGMSLTVAVTAIKAGYSSATANSVGFNAGSTPTAAVNDTFTRVDSSTLGTATSGQVWSQTVGTIGVVSNAAKTTGTDNTALIDSGITNYTIKADITQNGVANAAGILFRANDASTRLGVFINSSSIAIYVGTASVVSASISLNTSIAHTVKAVVNGNVITAYLDDVQQVQYTLTGSDATTYASLTKVGIRCYASGVVFDNFNVT